MDPDQVLRHVAASLDADDHQGAVEAFNNYTQWVTAGGFPGDRSLAADVDRASNGWADRLDTARAGRWAEIEGQSSRDPRGGAR